jgi:hypothetical protein
VEYLEWADAEKTKRTKELKKKYQDVLDLNSKEYHEAWQEVRENWSQYNTCWFHGSTTWTCWVCVSTASSWHPGANKTHAKLLRKSGYKFKPALGLRTAPGVAQDVHGIYAPWDSAPEC